MKRMKSRRRITLICALLTLALVWVAPSIGWSQTADQLQQVGKRLADKQTAAEAHRKQMESIKDPDKLATAMQRHFQMTDEIIALMVERRQLATAQSQPSGAAASSGSGMQGGGMGGMMEHGMGMGRGMMEKEMGGMAGSGMSGQAGSSGQSGETTESNEMQQMMQRLSEHSAYMETIKDRTQLSKEMLRHQRMLDQMLQLMQ